MWLHIPSIFLVSVAGSSDSTLDYILQSQILSQYVWLKGKRIALKSLGARIADGTISDACIFSDLYAFDGKPWAGFISCLACSLPCQPYSCAGKRKGHADERAIWPEFIRIVDEVRPTQIFMENVPGFLKYFRPIGARLSEMGYRIAAGLFTAAEVGAPHKRERIFILAHRDSQRLEGSESQWKRNSKYTLTKYGNNAMADTFSAEWGKNDDSRTHTGQGQDGQGKTTSRLGEYSQNLDDSNFPRLEGRSLPAGKRADQFSTWPPSPDGRLVGNRRKS